MPPSEIRRDAREALRGKWGKGVCILLAYLAFTLVIGFVQGLFSLIPALYLILGIATTIISVPLALGLVISFMKLKRGENVSAFGFFGDGLSRIGKAWGIAWHTFIRMLLPMICMFLIVFSFIAITTINTSSSIITNATSAAENYKKVLETEQSLLSEYQPYSESLSYDSIKAPQSISQANKSTNSSSFIDSPLFTLLFVVIYIATLIYVFSRSLLYVLAQYICYDNPELSSKECVVTSAKMMKGNRGNYFLVSLSFIGWAILAAFTLYIGCLWLIPYMQVAMVCFYDRLINREQGNSIEEL